MLEQTINRITDILRRDDGISGAMHYTEQISWILFLKFLDDFEENKHDEADMEGKKYTYIVDEQYRWSTWACPKDDEGKIDIKKAWTGDELKNFVDKKLFSYLQSFNESTQDLHSIKYKIGAIFDFIDNRIASGHTLREVLNLIDELNFQSKDNLFELSHVYEKLLKDMGSDGGNSGEFYTPRPVIRAIVQCLAPKAGQTIYDGAIGSGGFLVEAFEYMKKQKGLSASDSKKLQISTFYGYEKTPLAYVMGVMNMILHGIESPNVYKKNTLSINIRDIQESDRHDIILANPPFGGKEKKQIQQNFPIESNATELLFLQHFMKMLKSDGKAAIIVPEGVLFQTNNAFKQVKKLLLEDYNLHTIVSLPAGVFLPYSGVKTNIIFFERSGGTSDIWYYEVASPKKLTKNNPIKDDDLKDFIKLYSSRKETDHSWVVKVEDIKHYDLSAKNPKNIVDVQYESPAKILQRIKTNNVNIGKLLSDVESILNKD